MPINQGILGINARNYLYIRKFNPASAKRRADDKLATKKMLTRNNIQTTKLIYAFNSRKSLQIFDWKLPSEGFVVKPARGFGGEGILVFKSWEAGRGVTLSGKEYSLRELESHILDIFDGIYSLQSLPDKAYIEERVYPHPFFRKITTLGLPDIRVIVLHKIPVMAMLRLPTKESKGKANLHMGALGVGVDIRTGITKHAIYKDKTLKIIPETKIKTRGIKIPFWDEILMMAVETQMASKLGYAGVDIVVDANKGPLVLEINARPGLSIQNANLASLRSRLERVENLTVSTPERGVEIGKSLFAEDFSEKVRTTSRVISVIEPVTLIGNGVKKSYYAKLDTGAYRTSIDKILADELGIKHHEQISIRAASGQQLRDTVKLTFILAEKRIATVATTADRSHMQYPIIIGRRDLKGFFINPEIKSHPKEVQREDVDEEDNDDSDIETDELTAS